jgi:long-subunit acyl-CoA synthetase (AMP-forming)
MSATALQSATLCEAFQHHLAVRPDAPALREIGGEPLSWGDYGRRVARLAAGLASLGVRRGDTIAMMLENRVEFHLVDMAALHLGATPFSIYNTSSAEQIKHFFENAGNRILVCEPEYAARAREAGPATLEHIIVLEGAASMEALEALGDPSFDLARVGRSVSPDDVATLIYTSGTTGPPKGVELTHRNLLSDWRSIAAMMPTRDEGRLVSYLPCAHLADRSIAHYGALVSGACITTVPDPTRLIEALVDTRPTMFAGVPRIWEKLHATLAARAQSDAALHAAIEAGPDDTDARLEAVRAAVRESLGLDQIDWVASGAAPIAPEVLRFFGALGLPISEVWGMTEVGCVGTANPLDAIRYGTVGRALPGIEVALAEDGELLCRGPNVMRGYRGDPVRTAEALDADGWMHTGDLAEIDVDGYVTIVDRKKELIVNASGKNMSPANIERALKSAGPLIGQACVVGDRRPCNVALLVLDPDGSAGLDASDGDVLARVEAEVAAANARLSRVEQIKAFHLLGDEWLPDGDELTPTMKLKRRAIAEKYEAVIDALYRGLAAERRSAAG